MKSVNKVILLGRLGADPVHRETKNGTSVVHFPLATARRLRGDISATPVGQEAEGAEQNSRGNVKEETVWHKVVAWGRLAEICSQYGKKGDSVYVEGSMRGHKYEDKSGVTRFSLEVYADEVSFVGAARRASA